MNFVILAHGSFAPPERLERFQLVADVVCHEYVAAILCDRV